MRTLLCFGLLGTWLAGCGSSDSDGTCAGGASPVLCYTDYTPSRCSDMDSRQVNGGPWSYSSESCADRGFSKTCHNASQDYDFFVMPSESCP